MVLFCNISVGARVQVKWKGGIFNGKVRHKGGLVGREGDWVGVELDDKVGDNSGLFKGVRYFQCCDGHGIFTHPRNIRFPPNTRRSFDSYRTVDYSSSIDETLFTKTEMPRVERYSDPVTITQEYLDHAKKGFKKDHCESLTYSKNFHKRHLVGGRMLPAVYRSTIEFSSGSRPATSMSMYEANQSIYDVPQFKAKDDYFISPSSIPQTHVPRHIYKRMVQMNYFGTSIPRYNTLY